MSGLQFVSLSLVFAIASFLNHIDGLFAVIELNCLLFDIFPDTDEVYGYWEPLHYMMKGVGMQTWEYSPKFAIRTYAFIALLVPFSEISIFFMKHKLVVFYSIRLIIGEMSAICTYRFLNAIEKKFGSKIHSSFLLLAAFCPGIFFASTSFLPSAFCSSMVMLSFASWLNENFNQTITFGCIAVIWSGWPFVGVIFIPIGLHMLTFTLFEKDNIIKLCLLITSGILALFCVGFSAFIIDSKMYQSW